MPSLTKPTLFDQLVNGLDDKEELTEELKKFNTLVALPNEMHFDFCQRSCLQSIMDYQNPKAMQAVLSSVVDFVIEQGDIYDHKQLLMGVFPSMIALEDPPEMYCQFFSSQCLLDKP